MRTTYPLSGKLQHHAGREDYIPLSGNVPTEAEARQVDIFEKSLKCHWHAHGVVTEVTYLQDQGERASQWDGQDVDDRCLKNYALLVSFVEEVTSLLCRIIWMHAHNSYYQARVRQIIKMLAWQLPNEQLTCLCVWPMVTGTSASLIILSIRDKWTCSVLLMVRIRVID